MSTTDSSPPLDNEIELDAGDDFEEVAIRKDGESKRNSRYKNKERTPTTVVSEVFAFLKNPSMCIDNLDEYDIDGFKDVGNHIYSKGIVSVEEDLKENDGYLAGFRSKDSGFASLERHVHGDFDYANDADIVSKSATGHGKSAEDCWTDVSASEQSIAGRGSCSQDRDAEYDDVDVTVLKLDEQELNFQTLIENDQLESLDEIAAVNNSTLDLKTKRPNGLINSVIKLETASNKENTLTTGSQSTDNVCGDNEKTQISTQKDASNQAVITVDFAKVKTGRKVGIDSSDSEDQNKSSLMMDSYFAYGDTGDVNTRITSASSDDEEDYSNIDTKDLSVFTANDQDYDTIDINNCQGMGDGNVPSGMSKLADVNTVLSGSTKPEAVGENSGEGSDFKGCVKSEHVTKNVTRRPKLEKNPSAEIGSDDSSDEDIGIYAESFRRSNWIRISQEGKLEFQMPVGSSQSSSLPSTASVSTPGLSTSEGGDYEDVLSPRVDDVFVDPMEQALAKNKLFHKRSDSVTTTASESEFKRRYMSRRKCLIQRADSQQEYHRLSARVYDEDKQVTVERTSGSDDLGLHLLNSHPAFITSVDQGSPAEKAGITEGQILVSVNEQDVLTWDHADIVKLIQTCGNQIKLGVANSDFQPVRDLQASVMSGFMFKLGNSSFMKIWKKRFFILRQDNCLYYYKNDQENDPLGALPLYGYTISRHTDTSKDFCFKAEKYGARTYYFMTDNRDQLTAWVGALTEAAVRSKKRKESFLSVSSHNVSLPALDIRKSECTGFLNKLSPNHSHWRRRYCVLKDACVYYYKDVNSQNALGVAHLHGYKVDAESLPRRKFSFSLLPPEKKMRVFCFSADNETDKKRWVESLIHSIQRWVRMDKEIEC
ncbi:uncharacterized protein LOC131929905 [Physella acuta]|uniref:uncharacterized protein LOC131929905 n=1 Tax=Physella acuta TaxID=109671 RepID=UPI0027DC45CB|nr:uncharacterized protein LOC131929905 [Physella acuta]XP_059142270.1 uncharacterized protein LOC131929905 [Physella acuta]XP_059142271.1 uncharacterized protein LOC131929905 [Physella acuta]